jgi:DNA-binding NarL/FixJ family response regulator
MTANDDETTRNEAVDAGCIAYLRKPFAGQVLLDAIAKAGGLTGAARARGVITSELGQTEKSGRPPTEAFALRLFWGVVKRLSLVNDMHRQKP